MDRRELIDPDYDALSIRAQCYLLDVTRSSYYYEPQPESELNLNLMRIIDSLHLDYPFAGSRMMQGLLMQRGTIANRKRVQRLMRLMGIEAIFPKKSLSVASSQHIKFPYLLRGLTVERCNQVWGADITYLPIAGGFLYLFAILDWFSRYVVEWQLSNSLSNDFCLEAVKRAFNKHGKPEIFNTDQGVQFTSNNFVSLIIDSNVKVSMDGKGRALDNVFTERLWRTVKYEEVYIKDYDSGLTANNELKKYFQFYNQIRPHSALAKKCPATVYKKSC